MESFQTETLKWKTKGKSVVCSQWMVAVLRSNQAGLQRHIVEDCVLVLQQILRTVVLGNFALVQHEHLVVVHDRVETVSDRGDRAVIELLSDRLLNELVCGKHRNEFE